MPVSEYVHREPAIDGKPVFLIRTPNRHFSGRRGPSKSNQVDFFNGRAATTSERRAIWFCEVMDYEVILPTGHPGLNIATSNDGEYEPDDDDEMEGPELFLREDPEDEDEDGEPIAKPARRQPATSRYQRKRTEEPELTDPAADTSDEDDG